MRTPPFLYALASLLVVAAVGVGRAPLTFAQSAGCAVNPTDLAIDAEEQSAVDAINALRAEARLPALGLSPALGQAAAAKSATMAATGLFSHDDPGRSWLRRIQECGYPANATATENLALGPESGREAVQIWRGSAAHAQNMLDPAMRAIGIARARSAAGGWYWTVVFGATIDSPAPERAAPTPPSAPPPANPPTPPSLQPGGIATVNAGSGDCLNVRAAPGKSAAVVGCLPDGAVVRIARGPVEGDGIAWWQLDTLGWVAGEFLTPGN